VDELVEAFHRRYSEGAGWSDTYWIGVKLLKCPLDLWVYQEILFRTRPDVIVETGTLFGGSALFLASVCDILENGRIVTVDVKEQEGRPAHPRIVYLTGSSVAPEVVSEVRDKITDEDRVMVILDSDHRKEHVLAELRAYGPLVSDDCYLVVEDTRAPGLPETVQEFLAENPSFVIDTACEKFLMTYQPGGYLRRRATSAAVTKPARTRSEPVKRKIAARLWERALKERGLA